jgi:DNA-3-methyladenine glycosylase II
VDTLDELDDEAVIGVLTAVKGVGVWTAHMFLLFRLGRPDVLPVGDLGIQTAIQRAFALDERPSPKEVARIGAAWSPHASVAAWYLWRYLDNGVWA